MKIMVIDDDDDDVFIFYIRWIFYRKFSIYIDIIKIESIVKRRKQIENEPDIIYIS